MNEIGNQMQNFCDLNDVVSHEMANPANCTQWPLGFNGYKVQKISLIT